MLALAPSMWCSHALIGKWTFPGLVNEFVHIDETDPSRSLCHHPFRTLANAPGQIRIKRRPVEEVTFGGFLVCLDLRIDNRWYFDGVHRSIVSMGYNPSIVAYDWSRLGLEKTGRRGRESLF